MAINYDREKQELTRRNFLSLTANGLVGAGLLGAAAVFGKFFWPNVSYGPPSKFSIGKPTNFPDAAKQNIADQKVSIIRHGNKIGAISMVCQHLGCTVAASRHGLRLPLPRLQVRRHGHGHPRAGADRSCSGSTSR